MSDVNIRYARMLEAQAKLQFPFERFLYGADEWAAARTVLDFGCGDGSYVERLSRCFPSPRYYGIDNNPEILAFANPKARSDWLTFHQKLDDIGDTKIDFALLRYVVMHLQDRAATFQTISNHLNRRSTILIVEPDDRAIQIRPNFPLMDAALRGIKSASRARNLQAELDPELQAHGFALSDKWNCVISDGIEQVEQSILAYIFSLLELGLQASLSVPQKASLLDWFLDNSRFVQFGFYARLYTREK